MSPISTRGKTPPEGRTLNRSTVRQRAAAELPRCRSRGWCLSGGTHLHSPAQAQQRAGLPAVSGKTGTETAKVFLTAQDLFVCMHTALSFNINSHSLPHRKTGETIQPSKKTKLHLVNRSVYTRQQQHHYNQMISNLARPSAGCR